MNKKYFNMIEILLAMGIIAIGFVAVVGLLPSGLKVTREGQENSYVTLAADTMCNYIRGEAMLYDLSRWKSTRESKMAYLAIDTDYATATRAELGKISSALPAPKEFGECNFSKPLIPDYHSTFIPSTFKMLKSTKSGDDFAKMHHLIWATEVKGEEVMDFECIATVGLSLMDNPSHTTTQVHIEEGEGNVFLTVRIEWPATSKVEDRSYREFNYYVF